MIGSILLLQVKSDNTLPTILSCPGGNPIGGTCTTCNTGFQACPSGGCYPLTGYSVVKYCGTDTANVICGACPNGLSATTSSCSVVNSNVLLALTCGDSSSSTSSCFSPQESLTLISGETVPMDQVKIGDQVQVASFDGKMTTFSPVIAIPHPRGNSEKASFVHLTTETGRDIRMTRDHLVMGGVCGVPSTLKEASTLDIGNCLVTVQGEEIITSVISSVSTGISTVVTMDDDKLLVVNGVIASPFASNHLVANAFYNIHRALYQYAPTIVSHPIVAKVMNSFADMIVGGASAVGM